MSKNPEIDAYISKSADFAQPILIKLRGLVHQAHPGIEESIKWGMPNFEFKGMLFNMAGFKQHCTFGFWKGKLLNGLGDKREGMGNLGKIKSLNDLPSDGLLISYMKEAVELNKKGIKLSKKTTIKKELIIPEYVVKALSNVSKARGVFEGFSYSHQKEYVEWITEAKRETTREKRINQMLEWLVEGKHKNWKYENC